MLNVVSENSDAEDMSTTTTENTIPGEQGMNQVPTDEAWELNGFNEVDNEDEGGVLIVPPVDLAAAATGGPSTAPAVVVDPKLQSSGMELSVPGSIPSDIGSLHHSDILQAMQPPAVPVRDRNEFKEDDDDEVILVLRNPRVVVRRRWILPMALGLTLSISLISNAVLLHKNSDLTSSVLELKRELMVIREEMKLRDEKLHRKTWSKPLEVETKPPVCLCEETKTTDSTTTLVDNCWLHARANVQLGSCVEDAKKNVQDQLNRLQQTMLNVKDRFTIFANHPPQQTQQHRPDTPFSPIFGGMSFQGVRDAAALLVSGVAYAAVASMLIEDEHPPQASPSVRETAQKGDSGSSH